MSELDADRKVVDVHTAVFQEYAMEGPVQPDITWLPISWDQDAGQGSYLMRMEAGAATLAHEHQGFEEFLILEGTLTDADGTVFRAGDFVSYEGGTHHSWTDEGCLIAVFEWKR
jgi:anti-sigma factor ChrR (cupin superfamily)